MGFKTSIIPWTVWRACFLSLCQTKDGDELLRKGWWTDFSRLSLWREQGGLLIPLKLGNGDGECFENNEQFIDLIFEDVDEFHWNNWGEMKGRVAWHEQLSFFDINNRSWVRRSRVLDPLCIDFDDCLYFWQFIEPFVALCVANRFLTNSIW